jgi:nitrogen regulatory protein PII
MKMIEAIVESEKVNAVRAALSGLGMSNLRISGAGGVERRKGGRAIWFPSAYTAGRPEESKIEVAVDDANVEDTVTAIIKAAKIVAMGNDDEFTSTVGDSVRIRAMDEDGLSLPA